MKYDVFISYSRKDTEIVRQFIECLEQDGITIWYDKDGIESGDRFKKKIVKAIEDSAVFVFFSSCHSNVSEWTAKEIGIAVNRQKKILPVKLDDSKYNEDVEFDLINLDFTDYSALGKESFLRVLNSINKYLDEHVPNRKNIKALKKRLRELEEVLRQKVKEYDAVFNELKQYQAQPETEKPLIRLLAADYKKAIDEKKQDSSQKGTSRFNLQGRKVYLFVALAAILLCIATGLLMHCGSEPEDGNSIESCEEPAVDVQETDSANVKTIKINGVAFKMVYVEGGSFAMGASKQDTEVYSDETLQHKVTLDGFYIGQTEVTQQMWHTVMNTYPSDFKGDNRPVESVSWNDCQEFIKELNSMTGKTFALPTEAQWEFAARGGNKTCGYKYSGSDNLAEVAWYKNNSGSKTHDVATLKPNELGLYDMNGNVREWCEDWLGRYDSKVQTNPTGPSQGYDRVYRGGGFYSDAKKCHILLHNGSLPNKNGNDIGLRLVLRP